jgi:hypothetical protein
MEDIGIKLRNLVRLSKMETLATEALEVKKLGVNYVPVSSYGDGYKQALLDVSKMLDMKITTLQNKE